VRVLDLTLPSPAENLALDEALLDDAEDGPTPSEWLRLWEPSAHMVVVGRSSHVEREVHITRCGELGIPIVRRASGGAAIVTGPGCLMYAVVLSLQARPHLRAVDVAHRTVLGTIAEAIGQLGLAVTRRGTSDLSLGDRKFSGNSLRVRREHLLYHGTLLYDFQLELIAACLANAPRQPDYRAGRGHDDFVINLPVPSDDLRRALIDAWQVESESSAWPRHRVAELVASRYSRPEWNMGR
jgi:lipoate-protein ligase A